MRPKREIFLKGGRSVQIQARHGQNMPEMFLLHRLYGKPASAPEKFHAFKCILTAQFLQRKGMFQAADKLHVHHVPAGIFRRGLFVEMPVFRIVAGFMRPYALRFLSRRILSAIIAMNSLFVGLPRRLWMV